jgi:hypothetical protein
MKRCGELMISFLPPTIIPSPLVRASLAFSKEEKDPKDRKDSKDRCRRVSLLVLVVPAVLGVPSS